jgi:hypothetical protein
VAVRPTEVEARLTYEDGRVERVELHDGSGYLSQSSRTLVVPGEVVAVTLTRGRGASGPGARSGETSRPSPSAPCSWRRDAALGRPLEMLRSRN